MKIQFLIQLVATRTIHCSQGLTLDRLTFDLTSVTKHGLTYIALSRVRSKKNCIYLLHY
jgi:ATP-dependent exoDNAse (exonuclease V) alpha subunit